MSEPAIILENLRRIYQREDRDVHALDGVSLQIPRGETVACTGPSGSGKSTLLSLIGGIDVPNEGQIKILGEDLTGMSEDQRTDFRRRHLGFVFQNYHLLPTLTVCENVMMPLVPALGSSLELQTRALHCIEQVGLEKRLNHLPSELSGGEQQRVGLARALIGKPEILLADEPTGNLDGESAGKILDLIFALAGEGCTVLLSTHDLGVAKRCQHQIRLEAGKLVGSSI